MSTWRKIRQCLIIILAVFMLPACSSDSSVKKSEPIDTPSPEIVITRSASEYKNLDISSVQKELADIGFSLIKKEPIFDLNSSSSIDEGTVEEVAIAGNKAFSANDVFSKEDIVVITYHAIPKVKIPPTIKEMSALALSDVVQSFEDAGFVNINTQEIYDLDPDETSEKVRNEITVDNKTNLVGNSEVAFDVPVVIVSHMPFEKYNVVLHIDFVPNWFFSKYDVEFSCNDSFKEKIIHGQDKDISLRLKEGHYTMKFSKYGDSSVSGTVELDVDCDTEAAYEIFAFSDRVGTEVQYTDRKNALNDNQIKMMNTEATYINRNYEELYM